MNEYAGFKVGDKVEISIVDYAPIKGIITNFGDRKVGGFAEPDTLDVWIDKTAKFDMLYLRRHDQIKKLPKYAVGDMVREKISGTIYEVTMVLGTETYRSGDVCFLENTVAPFDGFRVGDTVFTVKRGMGKIYSDNWIGNTKERPFAVKFGEYCFQPKLSNLIPTEAKYKEAMTIGTITGVYFYDTVPCHTKEELKFVDFVHPGGVVNKVQIAGCNQTDLYGYMLIEEDGVMKHKSKFGVGQTVSYAGCIRAIVDKIHLNDGKFTYDLRTNACPSGVSEYSLSAVERKFKVGDVVSFDGKKCEVKWVHNTQNKRYAILLPCMSLKIVTESDLRLWKETKITHDDRMERCSMIYGASDFKSLKHIGTHLNGMDIFSQDAGNGKLVVWYGIKGDDLV